MNLAEALAGLIGVRAAIDFAWSVEGSTSRRRRLRTILLRLDREIAIVTEKSALDPDVVYVPVAGNFVLIARDLIWARNQADTLAISPAERGRVVSWVASILNRF